MKIIAVDDEALQLETIMEYAAQLYPDAALKGFTKVSDVLKYMETETADVAILDIELPGNINGINLGQMLRQKNKRIKLLYCTGYSDYAMDAFKIHANGYLRKPVSKQELGRELKYVLQMPVYDAQEKPYIHTFGNFDVFVHGCPIAFKRSKSKEVLAYLIDREGGWVTNRELAVILWDDSDICADYAKYITTLVGDMVTNLQSAGVGHIVERQWGKLRVLKNEVVCDYYSFLAGDPSARERFRQEYMSQYSWGEETLAYIVRNLKG